jgi:hypothetical protein
VPYAAAFTDGRTPAELAASSPAGRETAALWQHITACLHASIKTARPSKVRAIRG